MNPAVSKWDEGRFVSVPGKVTGTGNPFGKEFGKAWVFTRAMLIQCPNSGYQTLNIGRARGTGRIDGLICGR